MKKQISLEKLLPYILIKTEVPFCDFLQHMNKYFHPSTLRSPFIAFYHSYTFYH